MFQDALDSIISLSYAVSAMILVKRLGPEAFKEVNNVIVDHCVSSDKSLDELEKRLAKVKKGK